MPAKSKSIRSAEVKPAPKSKSQANLRRTATSRPAAPALDVSKLDQIVAALRAPRGATLNALMALTNWQAHSVRGAISRSLKTKRGLLIESFVEDGVRHYRLGGKA